MNDTLLLQTFDRCRSGESIKAIARAVSVPWQRLSADLKRWCAVHGREYPIGSKPAATAATPKPPAPKPIVPAGPLTDRYRPQTVVAIRGQDQAVAALSAFLAEPYPTAFLFHGPTGTGKTSAAVALAADLGCDLSEPGLGGLIQIASGEQTADTVRETARQLWTRPLYGSGWKVLVVNECDRMHPQTETVWLDRLENLPPRTVIVFTTNHADKLARRFRDRCERIEFDGEGTAARRAAVKTLLDDVWRAETGGPFPNRTRLDELVAASVDEDGNVSFRRAVQALQAEVNAARTPSSAN